MLRFNVINSFFIIVVLLISIGIISFVVFIMEIGDKTGLLVIALAGRSGQRLPVLIGSSLGLFFMTVIGALAGELLTELLPSKEMASMIGGIVFIVIGATMLLSKQGDEEMSIDGTIKEQHSSLKWMWLSFVSVGAAEFLDKTQFAVVALVTQYGILATVAGATLAFSLISSIEVLIGEKLRTKIPESLIQKIAGVLFVILGGIAVIIGTL